jgi:hypothetical protein
MENQADELCTVTTPPDSQQQTLVHFLDENASYTCGVQSSNDATRDVTEDPNTNFARFFERPILIYTQEWPVSGNMDIILDPWALWMRNKRVGNRLNNFKLFRGNLHLKFVINSNAFHWGSAIASYTPQNNSFVFYESTHYPDIMGASQRSHIMIDPTTQQGGQVDCPFFYYEDAFNLVSTDPSILGKLWLKSLTTLQTSQGSSLPVRVQVYAWCTDVKLTAPTIFPMAGLVPQADEFSNAGVISKPANVVSKVAEKLMSAPVIGKYAMVSKMAADFVGSTAQMFGYSRPRQVEDQHSYKLNQTGNLAATDMKDTSTVLAYSSKQEVTIDPKVTGIDAPDEMSFKYLYQKPSLLHTFPWDPSYAQNQLMFGANVTPMLCNKAARSFPPTSVGAGLAPMGLVALPFRSWRGKLKFRFQVVASAYHKGRVVIVWDPAGQPGAPEVNVQNSQIIDISKNRDFTIEIAWGNSKHGLDVDGFPTNPNYFSALLPSTGYDDSKHNGQLQVYVLNPLSYAGSNTNPIHMNVWISAEELEVWQPDGLRFANGEGGLSNLTVLTEPPAESPPAPNPSPEFENQAEEIPVGDTTTTVNAAPDMAPVVANVGGDELGNSSMIFNGDPIESFRTMVKRYEFARTVAFNITGTDPLVSYYFTHHALPFYPTQYSGGFSALSLITSCFAGWRGGMRYKVMVTGTSQPQNIFLKAGRTIYPQTQGLVVGQTAATIPRADAVLNSTMAGSVLANKVMGNVLEVEIPWYQGYARYSQPRHGAGVDQPCLLIDVTQSKPTATPEVTGYSIYQAAGDDFSVFYFIGVPTIYKQTI